ncbi:MAG: endonuclease, partial [Phaeodactylibacter sp.]|nr:endonuclease [Phaeodactylibacter sp.]
MQRTLLIVLVSLSLLLPQAYAQYEAVFPALDGPALIQALQSNYTPDQVLPFGNSRDTLFSRVDAHDDSLTCVYTGYTIYLDPAEDPTVAAFSKGINTEHTYPQAFGASQEPARADMHHLYPTREDVNAARANLPFREIPDGQAQSWFYLNQQQSNIPSANRDLYSEYSSIGFEPPEAQKGDVARAMFYFYTIYRSQANAEDPNFFESQRETLCEWHIADPVD